MTAPASREAFLHHIRARLRPEVAGPDAAFGFVVQGDDASVPPAFYVLRVVNGQVELAEAQFVAPDQMTATVAVTEAALREIVEGTLSPTRAYMGGRLRVTGSLTAARRIGDFWR